MVNILILNFKKPTFCSHRNNYISALVRLIYHIFVNSTVLGELRIYKYVSFKSKITIYILLKILAKH
ncbi:Hypothetical protein ERWE_CDS_00550 [Ehrlichia ruminantium str. Welgevonden]|uniref:Uncharacterized protein n=1 Tax=Ehrlichia ruminantium (strain Welgevonden) TaxID=254945 RepID=A0A0H3M508_EHRRW|nr:Hypothetical protein ERWE_CDS_00550 [Ehrlichia ruminantium str. Welgevonden]